MLTLIVTLAGLLISPAHAAVDAGQLIDTEAFCSKVQGVYNISSANGIKPKAEAEVGSVEKDDAAKECIFSFPYCIENSSCDPGYLFFGFKNTRVYESEGSNSLAVYELVSEMNGKETKYLLELGPSGFHFTNYQYTLPTGNVVTLEHTGMKN